MVNPGGSIIPRDVAFSMDADTASMDRMGKRGWITFL